MSVESRATKRQRFVATGTTETNEANWEDLPATAIHLVVLFSGGTSGLNFCAACKAYRAAQPPLRVLLVNARSPLEFNDEVKRFLATTNKDDFCLFVKSHLATMPKQIGGAHRFLESLPACYAREITHLSVTAWQGGQCGIDEDFRSDPEPLLAGPTDQYGKNFASLHTLQIIHPIYGQSEESLFPQKLRDCALQLVRATKDTLRVLSIDAKVHFKGSDAEQLFTEIGLEKLHHISLNLIPFCLFASPSDEADTNHLRKLAKDACSNLLEKPQIICHHSIS